MKSFQLTISAALTASLLCAASGAALAFDDLYVRGEVGGTWQNSDSASWTTPGGTFQDMKLGTSGSASVGAAVGGYFVPNIRGDLSYTFLGHFDLDSCKLTAGNSDCGESHNSGSLNSHLFMANIFLEAPQPVMVGSASVTPFVTAGAGAAVHDFGVWNHIGTGGTVPPTPVDRDFQGKTSTDFAWTVGAGASVDVSGAVNRPAFVDITWRYTDAGTAKGSPDPVANGSSATEAYNVDVKSHSVFVGLRIPLGK